jgi:hypothetical protein
LFDALEARASVEGPFEQFGPEVRPYMTEAKQALDSEPTDPRMKSGESCLRRLPVDPGRPPTESLRA